MKHFTLALHCMAWLFEGIDCRLHRLQPVAECLSVSAPEANGYLYSDWQVSWYTGQFVSHFIY